MTGDQRTSTPPQRARPLITTVAFVVLCAAVAVYFTRQLDIGLYDETAYLQRGAAIDTEGMPTADMAPLYSLWYRFLQVFIADPVQRYFVHYGLTIALLPLGVFLLLKRLGTSPVASFATGVFILCSTLNVLNWPRVSVFALLVLIAGLLLFLRASHRDRGWACLFTAAAISVFIRPEFVLSVAAIGALWGIGIWRRMKRGSPVAPSYAVVGALFAAMLFIVLGNPFANGRSMVAFGQHYALNWTEANDSDVDPWTNWEAICQQDLGTTTSLSHAITTAPDKVMWHIGRNIRTTAPTLARMFMPAGARPGRWGSLLLLATLASTAWLVWKNVRGTGRLKDPFVAAILALCLPAVISAIIIHPRQHYLIFPAVLLLVLLVSRAFPNGMPKQTRIWAWLPAVTGTALLLAYTGGRIAAPERPVLSTIGVLRSIEMKALMVILDADGGYDAYLPEGTRRCTAQDKAAGFNSFRAETGVNVIVVSPRLEADQRFSTDPEWQAFADGGYAGGFDRISVPGTTTHILVARADQP